VEQGASIHHHNSRGKTPYMYSQRHPTVLAVLNDALNVRRKLLNEYFMTMVRIYIGCLSLCANRCNPNIGS
jgi:hypothetical protein